MNDLLKAWVNDEHINAEDRRETGRLTDQLNRLMSDVSHLSVQAPSLREDLYTDLSMLAEEANRMRLVTSRFKEKYKVWEDEIPALSTISENTEICARDLETLAKSYEAHRAILMKLATTAHSIAEQAQNLCERARELSHELEASNMPEGMHAGGAPKSIFLG